METIRASTRSCDRVCDRQVTVAMTMPIDTHVFAAIGDDLTDELDNRCGSRRCRVADASNLLAHHHLRDLADAAGSH